VSSDVGDLSVFNLFWLLSEELSTKALREAKGFLNAKRVYEELGEACTLGCSVNDDRVQVAGKRIKPVTKGTVDGGFDSELTSEPIPIEESVDFTRAEEVAKEAEESVHTVALDESPVELVDKRGILISKRIKRPDPSQFYVERDTWEQLIYCIARGINVCLTGPAGSGKTEICYLSSKAVHYPIAPFNFGAMTEPRTALVGNMHFNREKGTWFEPSRFVRANTAGYGCILLDEITRAGRDAFNLILPLMDRQRYLSLDEAEDAPIIKRSDHVAYLCTANIGMEYTGTEAMDVALEDRLDVTIDMYYPPADNEIQILVGRCKGLERKAAERLVKIATRQRELHNLDNEFSKEISTRMLIAAGEQIGLGVPFDQACKFCIINKFDKDGGDASQRVMLKQIVQREGAA